MRNPDAWKNSPLGEALQFAGITPGELTDRMGGAYVEVIDIADRQLELGSLPLDTAKLIANALDLPLAELSRFDGPEVPTREELDGTSGRALIAVLNDARDPISIASLGEYLGWDSEQVQMAISTANSQLVESGFRVEIDEEDRLTLIRKDSLEVQALKSKIERGTDGEEGGGLPTLDSCAVSFALIDLAQGDVDGFNRGQLSTGQLTRLVDENVIEPYGDSYWLTARIIELLDLGIPTTQQLDGADPTGWIEASRGIRQESFFGYSKSEVR